MPCLKVPFARRLSDNRIVDASMVNSGKGCGCVCGACGTGLIARHPRLSKRVHHFAHHASLERPCKTALETALHKAAKQIIHELPAIWLPASVSTPASLLAITESHIEFAAHGVVADVLVRDQNGRSIAVEIRVAHEVAQVKRTKLAAARFETIEIDLRKVTRLILYGDLVALLSGQTLPAFWIYNDPDRIKAEADEARRLEALQRAEDDRKFEDALRLKREADARQSQQEEKRREWAKLMPWAQDSR